MTRTRWIAAASIAAGVALLAVLVAFTPWRLLAERVATVPWPGWVGATLGMSATYALRAGRLRAEWLWKLRTLGLGYRECLQITLLHNAAINILPMRSGEASYSFLLHRRWGVGLGDATASLLWLRLQDMMVLGVLGIAILVPAPLPWRIGFARRGDRGRGHAAAGAGAPRPRACALGARAGARGRVRAPPRKAWHLVAKVAAAFRAARGGAAAWGFAIANWVLKLGIVGVLLASLANLPLGAGFCGALGGELAGVIPLQAPAGVGTYEAGVALGTRAHRADGAGAGGARRLRRRQAPQTPTMWRHATSARLIFGAALAVHALMLVVALATALAFSLIVRPLRAPESKP